MFCSDCSFLVLIDLSLQRSLIYSLVGITLNTAVNYEHSPDFLFSFKQKFLLDVFIFLRSPRSLVFINYWYKLYYTCLDCNNFNISEICCISVNLFTYFHLNSIFIFSTINWWYLKSITSIIDLHFYLYCSSTILFLCIATIDI